MLKMGSKKKRKMRATTTNKSIRSISEVYMMVCVLEVYNITSFEKKKMKGTRETNEHQRQSNKSTHIHKIEEAKKRENKERNACIMA